MISRFAGILRRFKHIEVWIFFSASTVTQQVESVTVFNSGQETNFCNRKWGQTEKSNINIDVPILENKGLTTIVFFVALSLIWWKKSIYDNIDIEQ